MTLGRLVDQGPAFTPTTLTHFHVRVSDMADALGWFERVCELRPAFQNAKLAYLKFGDVTLVLEPGKESTEATIAFGTSDCDRDYERLVARGAVPVSPPTSQPWGVRGAYLQGPAGITFELEQRINEARKPESTVGEATA
jgi:predicted enzyme related to lactoylglutathione lyase